jgi:Polyketide cyclase / dehydrase and lipid transport/Protein of unknown function (DUF2934)
MGSTTHSIEVNAPLRVVYNQWTQFEEFPRFMESVDEVRQDGPKRLFWKAKIAGKDKRWEAEITEQIPDKRIAWVSVDGAPNTGEVTFESMELERTLITLTMEYEPEGFLEMAGDVLGIPSGQVEEDLKRFRDFIEQTGRETGGWRGRIGEGPDLTAGAVSQESAQSVETVNERTDREMAPHEAQIETDRILGEQDEFFQAREHPSKLADEHQPLVAERLGEPYETAPDRGGIETAGIQAERGESFQTGQHSHDLADKYKPLAAERLGEAFETAPGKGGMETAGFQAARGESFQTIPPLDLADEPTALADDQLGEQGKEQIEHDKAGVIRPTDEQIARRAYELYVDRGQTPGHELEDWLKAEWELSENWGK